MENLSDNTASRENVTNEWQTLSEIRPPEETKDKPNDNPAIDYIEKSGLNNTERMENLIQNGSYEDFKVHLVRLNALFRNISPEEHSIDGDTVRVADNLVPISTEYKEQVVGMAFDSLRDLQPKDRGVLMYNILGAVHLFGDGNGRSMRVWHHLLSGEQIDHESMTALTEHDNDTQSGTATTGRKEIQKFLNARVGGLSGLVNRIAFKPELEEIGANKIGAAFPWITPQFSDDTIKSLSVDELNRVKNICTNDTGAVYCPFNIMTMYMLSKENSTFTVPPAEIENDMYMYDNETSDDIYFTTEQAKRFIAINNELKMRSFRTMIDIFQNAEQYKYGDGGLIKESFYAQ